MSLPAAIRRFLHSCDELSEVCSRQAWGTVTRNSSFPRIHDANHAWVFGPTTPSIDEVRVAVLRLQRLAPVPYTQVEVVDTEPRPRLMAALADWLGPARAVFAVMIGPAPPLRHVGDPPRGMTVAEQPFPGHGQWRALIDAVHEDEPPLPSQVLDELAARDTTVFSAAGRRFFAVRLDNEIVGHASLLSLHGVGLIDNVGVLPAHRRRGAAMAVTAAALAASAAQGDDATFLFTSVGSGAQRLYTRLGMSVIARAAQFRRDEAPS